MDLAGGSEDRSCPVIAGHRRTLALLMIIIVTGSR
jgi:hypothetical protein